MTFSCEADTGVNAVPATPPNFTDVAPDRFEPFTVTTVPPAVGPATGDTDDTTGAARYVYRSAATTADVPPGVVTRTSTVPAPCAGAVTFSCEADTGVNAVPATPPNFTDVAPDRFEPFTVTTVPPAVGPATGDTDDTTGAETANAAGNGCSTKLTIPTTVTVETKRANRPNPHPRTEAGTLLRTLPKVTRSTQLLRHPIL